MKTLALIFLFLTFSAHAEDEKCYETGFVRKAKWAMASGNLGAFEVNADKIRKLLDEQDLSAADEAIETFCKVVHVDDPCIMFRQDLASCFEKKGITKAMFSDFKDEIKNRRNLSNEERFQSNQALMEKYPKLSFTSQYKSLQISNDQELDRLARNKKSEEDDAAEQAAVVKEMHERNEKDSARIAAENKIVAEEEAKLEAKLNSKECKLAQSKASYCNSLALARLQDLMIAKEKKVGAISGFVDAKALHNMASSKLIHEEYAEKNKAEHKKLGGPSLNVEICKLVEKSTYVVISNTSFNDDRTKLCGRDY